MSNLKLILSYHGASYVGWQKNRDAPTIEGVLEEALVLLLRHPVILQAASRTDAGVHAEGQVVNFHTTTEIPLDRLAHKLNSILPQTMRVKTIELMPDNFHPTLDNTGKAYVYQICNSAFQLPFYRHISWHFYHPLDLNLMNQAASQLRGTHDFSAFCNARDLWTRSPLCTITELEIEPLADNRMQIWIRGDHFLYKMVRNLVGTLAHIGCGKLSLDLLPSILAGKLRSQAGITAPAHGLCLQEVFYGSSNEIC